MSWRFLIDTYDLYDLIEILEDNGYLVFKNVEEVKEYVEENKGLFGEIFRGDGC